MEPTSILWSTVTFLLPLGNTLSVLCSAETLIWNNNLCSYKNWPWSVKLNIGFFSACFVIWTHEPRHRGTQRQNEIDKQTKGILCWVRSSKFCHVSSSECNSTSRVVLLGTHCHIIIDFWRCNICCLTDTGVRGYKYFHNKQSTWSWHKGPHDTFNLVCVCSILVSILHLWVVVWFPFVLNSIPALLSHYVSYQTQTVWRIYLFFMHCFATTFLFP